MKNKISNLEIIGWVIGFVALAVLMYGIFRALIIY